MVLSACGGGNEGDGGTTPEPDGTVLPTCAGDPLADTGLPSDFPSGLPTEGLDAPIGITVGDGFDLPRATIQPGWTLEAQSGVPFVQITGMKAALTSGGNVPVLFAMSFPDADGGQVETVCTASGGTSGATVDVTCVPLFGDVADAVRATVTASL